jgi:hypothetical protein
LLAGDMVDFRKHLRQHTPTCGHSTPVFQMSGINIWQITDGCVKAKRRVRNERIQRQPHPVAVIRDKLEHCR